MGRHLGAMKAFLLETASSDRVVWELRGDRQEGKGLKITSEIRMF